MTQGRKPPFEPTEDGTLFELPNEHPGGIADLTPPAGVPTELMAADSTAEVGPPRTPASSLPATTPGTDESVGLDQSSSTAMPFEFDSTTSLKPDQIFNGRYKVVRQLGEGGMGTVWLVQDIEFGTEQALKLIVSGIAGDQQARKRFQREARILFKLNHPNAVRVFDARIGRDAAYIAMEYVRGQNLNEVLVPGAPMPMEFVVELLDQLCDVLQEANDNGIIHRDLKPPNMMLVEGRQPGKKVLKLLDFGIAKTAEGADDVRTQTGSFMGTPLYSSPEQIMGEKVDPRSDIYSVGVILYELLTGFRPFGGTLNAVVFKHVSEAPPTFEKINPNVKLPAAIEQVVMKCLAKNPDERPQTPRDLALMFHEAAAGIITKPKPLPRTAAPSEARRVAASLLAAGKSRRYTILLSTVGVALAVALFVLAPRFWPDRSTVPPPPKPVPETTVARIAKQKARWLKRGFVVDFKAGNDAEGWPKTLKREEDEYNFNRTASGVYLPARYEPVGGETAEDGYPKTLRRLSDDTRFARIAGGTFTMDSVQESSAGPGDSTQAPHEVWLSGFYMQTTEVTNREVRLHFENLELTVPAEWTTQYSAVSSLAPDDAPKHPAVFIPWQIAQRYAVKQGGMLPTEAQWEYAARSRGRKYQHVYEYEPRESPPQINTAHPEDGTTMSGRYTADVTLQGVKDMEGNVREWCRDVKKPYVIGSEPLIDPEYSPADKTSPPMVVRGGSFATDAVSGQTNRRGEEEPNPTNPDALRDVGFRLVIECPESLPAAHRAAGVLAPGEEHDP